MTSDYDKERVVASAEQLPEALRAVIGDGWTYQTIRDEIRGLVWWATNIVMKDKEDNNETQG